MNYLPYSSNQSRNRVLLLDAYNELTPKQQQDLFIFITGFLQYNATKSKADKVIQFPLANSLSI